MVNPLQSDAHLITFAIPAMIAVSLAITLLSARTYRLGRFGVFIFIAFFLVFLYLNYSL